ncbi:XAP5, circadian clock regulator-domain-containing protein [Triangularia verruculosa]|uniref:XAP5, circadian clock regulator-domain-containing protein n=1 Tax=Triangularia verruculosa TaxID=2587418 RepID=A0AAN7AXI1_9PEZI|nr:XAP5, circadian clock regulator-domain-containing protein [Triangularia verruculosa]
MSDQNTTSRFTAQNKTTNERLSSTTVGLVGLADFRKRRAEVLEQQEREAREAAAAITRANNTGSSAPTPPDRSQTGTPAAVPSESETDRQPPAKKKKVKRAAKVLVSFGDDEEESDEEDRPQIKPKSKKPTPSPGAESAGERGEKKKIVNTSAPVIPKALTKAARLKEQAEKDALRKEFLILQAAVKQTEIAIPFVFYDGTNIPGGIVRVKKGDHIWLFLDKGRKVGAELGVGGDKNANARRDWARVGVDDLMLVRGGVIIPHHYEFYFFLMNKTVGPGGKRLFEYSAEAPLPTGDGAAAAAGGVVRAGANIRTLEGAGDDPTWTKVVDRRWYQRNKHIYPASVWQEFDPDVDYSKEIQRDTGGNAFFFSGTK